MPIYEYQCENGHKFDRYLPLKDYKKPQTCDCGAESRKVISIPMINCDMQDWDRYISPVSGRPITSYKERKKDMEEYGCVDYEPSLIKHRDKSIAKADADLDKKIDETVEYEINNMPTRKREKLVEELKSGVDCVPERRTYNGS